MTRPSLYSSIGFKLAFIYAQLMPRASAQWLAPRIAAAIYKRLPQSKTALHANLARITGLRGPELDALCCENVENFSRMLADYFLCMGPRAVPRAEALLADLRGWEHLAAARAAGRGTIIVTGHLGHWELGGILLAQRGLPLAVVTLDEPTPELTRWRDAFRQRLGIRTIAVGPGREFAFVEMIQALRRNECVAMLVDRPYAGTGTPVRLFGHETEFSSAPALLAKHTGAAVLPAFVLRQPGGRYISVAEPAVPMSATADLAANTQRIASAFEPSIRGHPAQWFHYVPIWSKNEAAQSLREPPETTQSS